MAWCGALSPSGEPCTLDFPPENHPRWGLHSWDWDPSPPACPTCGSAERVQEMGHYGMPTREFYCVACHPKEPYLHLFQREAQ